MSGAIPPLLQYAFMAWCSVKSTGATLALPHLRLVIPSDLLLSGSPTEVFYIFSLIPCVLLDYPSPDIGAEYTSRICNYIFSTFCPSSLLRFKCPPQHLILRHSQSLLRRVGDRKTKNSELNGSKHSPNLIFSEFLRQCNFDL
jgi:hypothetical protein